MFAIMEKWKKSLWIKQKYVELAREAIKLYISKNLALEYQKIWGKEIAVFPCKVDTRYLEKKYHKYKNIGKIKDIYRKRVNFRRNNVYLREAERLKIIYFLLRIQTEKTIVS